MLQDGHTTRLDSWSEDFSSEVSLSAFRVILLLGILSAVSGNELRFLDNMLIDDLNF